METLIASVRRQWSLDGAGEVVVSAVVIRASLPSMTMLGEGGRQDLFRTPGGHTPLSA